MRPWGSCWKMRVYWRLATPGVSSQPGYGCSMSLRRTFELEIHQHSSCCPAVKTCTSWKMQRILDPHRGNKPREFPCNAGRWKELCPGGQAEKSLRCFLFVAEFMLHPFRLQWQRLITWNQRGVARGIHMNSWTEVTLLGFQPLPCCHFCWHHMVWRWSRDIFKTERCHEFVSHQYVPITKNTC